MTEHTLLTQRQLRFVQCYVACGNAAKAAREAGYLARQSERVAHRLLHDPRLNALIEEGIKLRNERLSLSTDWVVLRLKAEAEYQGEGSTHTGRVAALTQLAKIMGLYRDTSPVSAPVEFIINMGASPDEQHQHDHCNEFSA